MPPPKPSNHSVADTPLRFGVMVLAAGASARWARRSNCSGSWSTSGCAHCGGGARSEGWPVVVVLGAHAEKIRPALARVPVLFAENPAWAEGLASSIRAGMGTMQQFSRRLDAVLVALGDQPAFSADVIARLVAGQRSGGRSIVAARYRGRQGAPALFLREHFPALAALIGEEGARSLLNDDPSRITAVDLPALGVDLDTPEEHTALWSKNSR